MSKRLNYKASNNRRAEAREKQEIFLAEVKERAMDRIVNSGRTAWDDLKEKAEFKIKAQGYRIAFLEKRVKELEEELGKLRTEQSEDRGSQ